MAESILVVDDDPELLDLTKSLLVKRDFEVRTALNGAIAMQELENELPDLILADVLMPEMDGYTFFKSLKNNPLTANVPVLIITGRAQMEDSFEVMGVDGFITKPFTSDDLISEIEHILRITTHKRQVCAQGKNLGGKKVLAISTDKYVLNDIIHQGQKAGYVIETAQTAADGIAKSVKFFPDMLFIDVHLYDLSSGELVDILRRLPLLEKKPIIGFCYYHTEDLGDKEIRSKVLRIDELSKRLLKYPLTAYMGRYSHQTFIRTILEYYQ